MRSEQLAGLPDDFRPLDGALKTSFKSDIIYDRGSSEQFVRFGGGSRYDVQAAVNAIRFCMSTGTISGTFMLLGLKSELPHASAKPVTESDESVGGTITTTDSQVRGADSFKFAGSPAGAFTMDIPDGDRRLSIGKKLSQTTTKDTVTGSISTITIANNEHWQFQQNGVEIVAKLWSAP